MRITSTGNVGIGTASPEAPLMITGSNVGDPNNPIISSYTPVLLIDSATTADTAQNAIAFVKNYDGDKYIGASIVAESNYADASGVGMDIAFLTNRNDETDGGLQEAVRISQSGNVGIGTASPTATSQLHVEADRGEIRIKGTNTANSDEIAHLILETATDRRAGITIEGTGNEIQAFMGRPYDSANTLVFETDETERMRITSTGNVSMGTLTAGNTTVGQSGSQTGILHLHSRVSSGGNRKTQKITAEPYDESREDVIMIGLDAQSGSNELHIGSNTSANESPTSIDFYTATANDSATNNRRMRIGSSGIIGIGVDPSTYGLKLDNAGNSGIFAGGIMSCGSFENRSDLRLKENIEPLKESLSILNQLKPVTFNLKEEKFADEKFAGFIAQEVEELYPIAVREEETDKKHLSIKMMDMIALLTKSMQELSAKVTQLESKCNCE
jgi:hypothetical protein